MVILSLQPYLQSLHRPLWNMKGTATNKTKCLSDHPPIKLYSDSITIESNWQQHYSPSGGEVYKKISNLPLTGCLNVLFSSCFFMFTAVCLSLKYKNK